MRLLFAARAHTLEPALALLAYREDVISTDEDFDLPDFELVLFDLDGLEDRK